MTSVSLCLLEPYLSYHEPSSLITSAQIDLAYRIARHAYVLAGYVSRSRRSGTKKPDEGTGSKKPMLPGQHVRHKAAAGRRGGGMKEALKFWFALFFPLETRSCACACALLRNMLPSKDRVPVAAFKYFIKRGEDALPIGYPACYPSLGCFSRKEW